MEQNFQTSFIPKKPMIEERAITARPVGFFFVISIFIFFTIVLATGGLYLYKANISKNIAVMKNDLNLAKNRFEPSKMKTVRYTKFSYIFGDEKNAKVNVKMSGQAIGYRSIALQSDLFTKNKHFVDPVFSNLALDNSGNVLFDLDFSVDPSFIDYKQVLLTENNENGEVFTP